MLMWSSGIQKKININYSNENMRSVLISVDFIYKQDGSLHPTELNTSTKDDLSIF
jgi:hypothetical protein